MTQTELDHEVALATNESPQTIAQMGFVPLTRAPYESELESCREPLVMDWDAWEWRRDFIFPDPRLSQRKLAAGDHVARE